MACTIISSARRMRSQSIRSRSISIQFKHRFYRCQDMAPPYMEKNSDFAIFRHICYRYDALQRAEKGDPL